MCHGVHIKIEMISTNNNTVWAGFMFRMCDVCIYELEQMVGKDDQ